MPVVSVGAAKDATRVCYARLDTNALLQKGLAGSTPYWQALREDISVNAIGDDESAGSVLLRVGVGALGEAVSMDWRSELRELESRKHYELRLHVFQGVCMCVRATSPHTSECILLCLLISLARRRRRVPVNPPVAIPIMMVCI